jgi:hypothetical protein
VESLYKKLFDSGLLREEDMSKRRTAPENTVEIVHSDVLAARSPATAITKTAPAYAQPTADSMVSTVATKLHESSEIAGEADVTASGSRLLGDEIPLAPKEKPAAPEPPQPELLEPKSPGITQIAKAFLITGDPDEELTATNYKMFVLGLAIGLVIGFLVTWAILTRKYWREQEIIDGRPQSSYIVSPGYHDRLLAKIPFIKVGRNAT